MNKTTIHTHTLQEPFDLSHTHFSLEFPVIEDEGTHLEGQSNCGRQVISTDVCEELVPNLLQLRESVHVVLVGRGGMELGG